MSDTDRDHPPGVVPSDAGSPRINTSTRGPAAPRGQIARARRRFEECRARGLLRATDVAARLGLSKALISRFQAGTIRISVPKLRLLEELLGDVEAGRVVLRVPPPKEEPPEQVADAVLHAVPLTLQASADAVVSLPLEGAIAAVERGLVLQALRRCDANMTAAGELLGVGRKRVAKPWAALERERAGAASTSKEARSLAGQAARDQMASDAWQEVPPVVRAFVGEVISAARPRGRGGAPALAEDILLAAAVRRSHGDLDAAAVLVGQSPWRVRSWLARSRAAAPPSPPPPPDAPRKAPRVEVREASVPRPPRLPQRVKVTASDQFTAIEALLRGQLVALATAFAYGVVDLVTRSSLEDLSGEL